MKLAAIAIEILSLTADIYAKFYKLNNFHNPKFGQKNPAVGLHILNHIKYWLISGNI
jgi:hypothetical protein